jgi:hypothetical protein
MEHYQKGGLVDMQKMKREISEQLAVEEAQRQAEEAYQRCLNKITDYFPSPQYTDNQRDEICVFVAENRSRIIEMGFDETKNFLNMFLEMVNNLVEREGITHQLAFGVVMRASDRFVN